MKRLALMLVVIPLAGCASARDPGTSQRPAAAWTPPAEAVPAPMPAPQPAELGALSLPRAIDIALQNNTATRQTWLQARAAQAVVGSRRSTFYPQAELDASYIRSHQTAQGGKLIFNTTSYGPSLALTWLLFDFGGREAQVEEARQALIAADYAHNAQIQNVVLQTEQAYYGFLNARALVDAENATIKEQQTNLDAAEERHRSGVATVYDVLQARTALSQAQLTLESLQQNLRVFQGALATAMGMPLTSRFDVGTLPAETPTQEVTTAVDTLIAQAEAQRPEFAAARANIAQAEARVREVRSGGLPAFSFSANASKSYFHGVANGSATPYSFGINMRFPFFTGWRVQYDTLTAKLEADLAREQARGVQQQIDQQVWNSYYGLSTASQRVRTTRDLLSSARQAADVATGRYRSGVGSILDVLTAEAALENARAEEVQARADWFVAVAQLAHDTGSLEPAAEEAK